MKVLQKELVKNAMGKKKLEREGKWTEGIAVGSKDYVESIRKQLNIKAIGRRTRIIEDGYELAEFKIPYLPLLRPKKI